jgi:catabolite regulation protein CreA
MTKREWLLIGIVIVLCVVIAGCSSPVKADSQLRANVVWLDDISDRSMLGYQSFSEIDVPDHNVTCFVARAGTTGIAMQCFKNLDDAAVSDDNIRCYNSGTNNVTCSYKPYG